MPLYEHLFLARQDVTAKQVETLVETYKGVIEANGGKVDKIEPWGIKSLAYRIKKNRKAHFTLLNISAPPAAVAEMERQMEISEDVLRFMTIRVEQLEAEPSAMMQTRDRDDRSRRHRDETGGFRSGRGQLGERIISDEGLETSYYGLYGLPIDESDDVTLSSQYDLILSQLRSLNDAIEQRLGGRKVHERGSVQRDQEWDIDTGGNESPQGQYR